MITPTSELAGGCEVELSRVSQSVSINSKFGATKIPCRSSHLVKNKVPSTYSHDSFMPYSLDTANSKQHDPRGHSPTV